MSAKLFTDPKQNQSTKQKQIRKIDDLILDAEKEAESEINRRIRSSNIRLVLIIAIGAGLIYMVNQGIQDKTIPFPSFLPEEPQVAKAPSIRKPTPKPIPFPVNESGEPATEEEPSDSASNDEMKENISPLENEVLSMLQSNLDDQPSKSPAPAGGEGLQSLPPKPAAGGKKSPFTPPPDQAAAPTTQEPRKLSQTLEPGRKLKVPSSTPMGSGANYFVQVGAFSVKSNADQVIKKLMSNGYSPLVQTRTQKAMMYTVFIGGFADEKSPQNILNDLKAKGLNPSLRKNDNGSYSIILGKAKSKARAELLQQKLTKMGIFTSLKQMKIKSRMFIVRVGAFPSNGSAAKNQRKIEDLGFKGAFIRKKS